MAIGSGLAIQLGWSAESTYGTFVAPTKFARIKPEVPITPANKRVQGEGLAAGAYGPYAGHYVETTKGGSAQVSMDLHNKGLGLLLQSLMGGTITPVQQGATAAYLATFPLADPAGKSLTVQAGSPYVGGTVLPQTMRGSRVTSATFSCTAQGVASAQFSLDYREHSTTDSLATASYSATTVFHGGQLAVKKGTYASETALTRVSAADVTITRGLDTEGFYAGQAGLKTDPLLSGWTAITVNVTQDWQDKATFQDKALATANESLVVEWVGPVIASTYYETFRVTVPGVLWEPAVQSPSGLGVQSRAWKGTWAFDGTNLPKIETISTDTTL